MTLKSNAGKLALIAQELGAVVIRGPVRYPGREARLPADAAHALPLETPPNATHGVTGRKSVGLMRFELDFVE